MRHKPDITPDAAVSLLLLRDNSLERRVLKILDMVEAGTTFAIRDLAAEFRLSPAYLLSNSYLSIKEITHTFGYEHTSSFIRAFERRFLQPPARYRKQNKRKYDAQGAKRIHAA